MEIEKIPSLSSTSNEQSIIAVLIRTSNTPIPNNNNNEEIDDDYNYNIHFDFNVFTSDTLLSSITNIMTHIYYPLVETHTTTNNNTTTYDHNSNDIENNITQLKAELSGNLAKFNQELRDTIRQVEGGDSRLILPILPKEYDSIKHASHDIQLITQLESVIEEWTNVLSTAIEVEEARYDQKVRTPLGELDFWRRRYTQLNSLYDQINTNKAQYILNIMITNDNPLLNNFNYQYDLLSKLCLESKDNIKFLVTLERHFRHIQTAPFRVVLETLPGLLNGRCICICNIHV